MVLRKGDIGKCYNALIEGHDSPIYLGRLIEVTPSGGYRGGVFGYTFETQKDTCWDGERIQYKQTECVDVSKTEHPPQVYDILEAIRIKKVEEEKKFKPIWGKRADGTLYAKCPDCGNKSGPGPEFKIKHSFFCMNGDKIMDLSEKPTEGGKRRGKSRRRRASRISRRSHTRRRRAL